MAIDNNKLAKDLLVAVGGKENVSMVVHCATRLRFTLKDGQKASAEKAKKLTGVITVVEQGGQFQVVIGNTVPEVHKAIVQQGGFESGSAGGGEEGPKGSLVNRFIDVIAGIFPPVLGAMCGGGLIKGILAICVAAGWLTSDMGTYVILNATGDAVFYFLPILLGFSAGRKFGANEYITALIGATLIYPDLVSLAGGLGGGTISFLGIPVVLMNYASSVVPILIAAYVCAKIEKFVRGKLPAAIRNFLTPMICLLLTVPLTLIVIGPVAITLSNLLASGYMALPPIVGGIVIGALWQVLVIFGMHWGFVPVMLNNIANFGRDSLASFAQVGAMSQTGAAFGMLFKMKNKGTKAMTMSTVMSGAFGITEPIVYGVTLPRKKPFVLGMIGGAVGGAVAGAMGAVHYSMGAFGILALPSTVDPVNGFGAGFVGTLVGMLVSFSVAAALTFIFYKDDTMSDETVVEKINCPIKGLVKPLSESKDPVHAQEVLGKGVLIEPEEGKVYAPFDGKIVMLFDTLHAVGLLSDDGVELLIHVGVDTVKLNGAYFKAHIKQEQRVTKGQLLLEFDMESIRAEGFDLETPVIVTNTADYDSVTQVSGQKADRSDVLLEVM